MFTRFRALPMHLPHSRSCGDSMRVFLTSAPWRTHAAVGRQKAIDGRFKQPKQNATDYHYFQRVDSKPDTSVAQMRTLYSIYGELRDHTETQRTNQIRRGGETAAYVCSACRVRNKGRMGDLQPGTTHQHHLDPTSTPFHAPCSVRSCRDSVLRARLRVRRASAGAFSG